LQSINEEKNNIRGERDEKKNNNNYVDRMPYSIVLLQLVLETRSNLHIVSSTLSFDAIHLIDAQQFDCLFLKEKKARKKNRNMDSLKSNLSPLSLRFCVLFLTDAVGQQILQNRYRVCLDFKRHRLLCQQLDQMSNDPSFYQECSSDIAMIGHRTKQTQSILQKLRDERKDGKVIIFASFDSSTFLTRTLYFVFSRSFFLVSSPSI
jgi:hypothetical protein